MTRSCFMWVVVALLLGCQKRLDISVAVTRVEVSFDQQGPSSVQVKAFGAWSAECLESWCRVEPHDDTTLHIWVEPNMGSSTRQAIIRVRDRLSSTALLLNQKILPGLDFDRYRDSLALMSIFRQGNGKEWTWDIGFDRDLTGRWSPDRTISEWAGVSTERIDGSLRVRGLDFRTINNFSGKLSDSLALINKLSWLYLGALPLPTSPLGMLSKFEAIEVLDISSAPYTVVWPADLGGLKALVLLYASNTRHPSDQLDKGWNELQNLQTVELSGCGLVGSFPQVLLDKSRLEHLNLSNNPKIGGSLPSRVGQLTNLEHLDLSMCGLTGALPSELGQLANLERLDLSMCALTGALPSELGQLKSLITLKAAYNENLGGVVPAALGAMLSLKELNLSGCAFTELPPEIWNCANLAYLDMSFNRLTGSIPVAVASMQSLEFLGLLGNQMSGEIPAEVLAAKNWKEWASASWICPQQTGYGFTNCK